MVQVLTQTKVYKISLYRIGRLGGSVGSASDFGSGHDLAVCEFEPRVGLCADSSEPGACIGHCVSFYPAIPLLGMYSFFFFLMCVFETMQETECKGPRGRQRETESEAGSRL